METSPSGAMVGILGGMGPLATSVFYRLLTELTPARRDQDHMPIMIWSNPTTPDRTEALLGTGPSPVESLRTGLRALAGHDIELVAVPCNTAHAFLDEASAGLDLTMLNMVKSAMVSAAQHSAQGRVGVLATRGTRLAGLYETEAAAIGVQTVNVSQDVQSEHVDSAIRYVKAGQHLQRAADHVRRAGSALRAQGADVVIGACTEIPVVAEGISSDMAFVDSMRALAEETVSAWVQRRHVQTHRVGAATHCETTQTL